MNRIRPYLISTNRKMSVISESLTLRNVGYAIFGSAVVLYVLFQKHMLPLPAAKVVSKLLFYPTFPITLLMRIGNYYTKVDDTLFLGCAPMDLFSIPTQMQKLGVRGVINMCYEYGGPTDSYQKLNIKQLRLPVVDHHEPTPEHLLEAVKFIDEHKKRGERVYVHCKAGHGRAASVALAWMIWENPHIEVKRLNELLAEKRRVRKKLFKQTNIIEFAALASKEKR